MNGSRPPRNLIKRLEERTGAGGDLTEDSPHATTHIQGFYIKSRLGVLRPTKTRAPIVDVVFNAYLVSQPPGKQDGRAALVLAGPPGAGKSTILSAIPDIADYRLIDSDIVKTLLLEQALQAGTFDSVQRVPHIQSRRAGVEPVTPAELSGLVHRESVLIAAQLRAYCMAFGENIIVAGTLANYSTARALAEDIAKRDYEHLLIVDAEADRTTVQKRALSRWWSGRQAFFARNEPHGGRFVPSELIERLFVRQSWSRSEQTARAIASEDDIGIPRSLTVVDTRPGTPVIVNYLPSDSATASHPPLNLATVAVTHCRRCGHRLTDPESVRIGLGPECR